MRKKIFIDAGHNPTGTFNTGAVGNGMTEQDIVFDVAKEMEKLLRGDFDVRLSRPSPDTVLGTNNASAINVRSQMANAWGADIFISIHVNAGGGTGSETFFFDGGNDARSVASNKLSWVVADTYAREMGLRNRGAKPDTQTHLRAIGVLRNTRMPATLVELAFIDSPQPNPDVGILASFRPEMAEALAKGIYAYFGMEFGQGNADGKGNGVPGIPELNYTIPTPPPQPTQTNREEQNQVTNPIFNTIQEVPDWARPTIEKLITEEALRGDENGNLNLCNTMVRIFTVLDRMGLFSREYLASSHDGGSQTIEGEAPPSLAPINTIMARQPKTLTDFETEALCKMVWAEARGEDDQGQRLVVHVILNRMASPNFPNGLLEVLFQQNAFSPVHNGAFDRATPCEVIRQNVEQALKESDQAQGATFFRTIAGAEGSWHQENLRQLFDYGGHRFYL